MKSQISVRRHELCARSCSKCWTYNQIFDPHTSSWGRCCSHPHSTDGKTEEQKDEHYWWENWDWAKAAQLQIPCSSLLYPSTSQGHTLENSKARTWSNPLPWHVPLHCTAFKTQEEGKTCTQEKSKWQMQGSIRSTRWSMTWSMTFVKETKGLCSSYHLFLHTTLSFSSITWNPMQPLGCGSNVITSL